MNRFFPIFGLVASVVILYLVFRSPDSAVLPPLNNTTTADSTPSSANYLPYSPSVLASQAGTKRVLYFYANWCPTCRPVDAELTQRSGEIPPGVTIIRVNYNDTDTDEEEKALAAKYAITYQHTFVQIDENGNALATWNGGGLSELAANLK